jgi:beta-lactamase regulating signal transducer with metallopeptidase domain
MIATAIAFSLIAATAVWMAGWRDVARDPRLTLCSLILLAVFPLLFFLPKWEVLPPADVVEEQSSFMRWLPWIWAAGVVIASLRLVTALAQLLKWRRESERVGVREAGDLIVDVRLLKSYPGPVAAGIWSPVIFVPAEWEQWSPETREAVLAHEMKHHQRRDPLWRAIGAVACTLHWCNPLVWWMSRRLADQCEFACDEAVVADGFRADRYANVLCDLAASAKAPATTLAMAHQGGLEARVRRMMTKVPRGSRVMLVLLILFTALTAIGLVILRRAERPAKPAIPIEEIRTRLEADPFPGD